MTGGFKLDRTQSQSETTGKVFSYGVDAGHASILAPGDVIRISGTANATTGNPEADAATATQSVTGILAAVDPRFAGEALSDSALPATTAGTIKVNVDDQALYEVDVSNGPLAVASVGLNADIVATAATATGGVTSSNMTLNATGVATTVTLPFRIVALREDSAGVLGNVAIVRINNSTISAGAIGV